MNHREVKRGHERAVIAEFVDSYNKAFATHYTIDSSPEPPDALLRSDAGYLWIEHSDVYRSLPSELLDKDSKRVSEAEEEMAYATGKTDICRTEQLIVSPDERIACEVLNRITDKLGKESYGEIFHQYGQGFLLLDARDPLFDKKTLAAIEWKLEDYRPQNDKGFFAKVFLAYYLKSDSNRYYTQIYSAIGR